MRQSCSAVIFLCLIFIVPATVTVKSQELQKQIRKVEDDSRMPPKKPFSVSLWKKYTQELTRKILKDQTGSENLISSLKIKIYKDNIVYAGSDAEHKLIEVYYGQIDLIKNEDEYVFVLAHELTHIQRQDKDIYILYGWTSFHDIELRRQEELEADEHAYRVVKSLGYNVCAPFLIEDRTIKIFMVTNPSIERQSSQGILVDIFQSRLDAMKKHCQIN